VGRIAVDAGAKRAVVDRGASLLAVGITHVQGNFRAGDGVELVGPDGEPFARGIAATDAGDLLPGVEAVHRDRLVLL
jgi:glutamate 5-kinase